VVQLIEHLFALAEEKNKFVFPHLPDLVTIIACFQMPDATPQQIKKAYYNCMKSCHPDLSGNDPDVTNFCMFINEVYTVKSSAKKKIFLAGH
jgi:hypothetical protein